MTLERGSTWNRWDFHVHTPYSILNNGFGCDPADNNAFDFYVQQLFTKAIEAGIVAIGITDYFSVDGYKRIRQEYLDKEDKLIELFPDEDVRFKVVDG